MKLDKDFWNNTYINKQPGWDIGYVSTPLKEYFDQIINKGIKILIPGAGNAYEVEYLYRLGFKNVFLLDYAELAINNFKKRLPEFPEDHILIEDFFEHSNKYDLIVEQTFLTSFDKPIRMSYAKKMHELLNQGGKLVGLLFNHEFGNNHPPFGGTLEEYKTLFSPYFKFKTMDIAYNSIKPRKDRELFFNLVK